MSDVLLLVGGTLVYDYMKPALGALGDEAKRRKRSSRYEHIMHSRAQLDMEAIETHSSGWGKCNRRSFSSCC